MTETSKVSKSEVARREEATLVFWDEHKIFNKSLEKDAPNGEYVFYEGPPTANGKPGIHHIEGRSFKDAIPRYKTMCGYRVRRKAGWDTHGLPVEIAVEKEIGSTGKKDIEAYGIAKFNAKCKESVLRYIDDWKVFTDRIGYWVDHGSTYFTFDNNYIESVWNVLKIAHDKKLLYKDYRIVPWCPRCGTGLSSHEVADGYADVKDISVTVKFRLKNPEKIGLSGDVYLLAWTTTPWTLPGNVALAVGRDIAYGVYTHEGETVIQKSGANGMDVPTREIIGAELVGLEYEPPFDYYINDTTLKNHENGWKVYAADFVTAESGTGIAHQAPAFGAEDWELAKAVNLPFVQHVNMDGTFKKDVKDFAGMLVKPLEDRMATDVEILKYLQHKRVLFSKQKIEHSYPHCWRCKTPLLYYARDSWYIRMSDLKDTLVAENQLIQWQPQHIRDGRFGEWLKDVKDWAISRNRYWGTPLPFWECEKCNAFEVFGAVAELQTRSRQIIPDDLHRPYIDDIVFACACGGSMHRVLEVLDVWFDSGAMPFAQDHYPFENKEWINKTGYPADYISEAIDQTRGWFYTLHAVGAGIMGRGLAFKNVICLGHILDAKGKKMSKSLGNIVEPFSMIDKYGVDALRYFMFTVNAPGDSKNFDERAVDEIVKKHIGRLGNVLAFYQLYADDTPRDHTSTHVLDRWIISRLGQFIAQSTDGYERYTLDEAVRPLGAFIDDLSVWYIRRSRDRFKGGNVDDKNSALATLRFVLHGVSRVMAPAMPFMAEFVFQSVREDEDEESVHLTLWPKSDEMHFDADILSVMEQARRVVSLALEARDKAGIKVRQPLASLAIDNALQFSVDMLSIIADEINVKEVIVGTTGLDLEITSGLREEGLIRELVRYVQGKRKEMNLVPFDMIRLFVPESELIRRYEDTLRKTLNASEIIYASEWQGMQLVFDESNILFGLEKA